MKVTFNIDAYSNESEVEEFLSKYGNKPIHMDIIAKLLGAKALFIKSATRTIRDASYFQENETVIEITEIN